MMRIVVGSLLLANAALFFFGALQHAGAAIGSFREPTIIPAAIVETICGIAMALGGVGLLMRFRKQWMLAMVGNAIALAGVLLGMVALELGAGPRTATNDFYHRLMPALIVVSHTILWLRRRAFSSTSRART